MSSRRSARRRFRCAACGAQPPPGRTVRLAGVTVRRRRRTEWKLDGRWRWEVVEVVSTAAYPARVCEACAPAFARKASEAPG